MASPSSADSAAPAPEDPAAAPALADDDDSGGAGHGVLAALKLVAAAALFYSAGTSFAETHHRHHRGAAAVADRDAAARGRAAPSTRYAFAHVDGGAARRRLSEAAGGGPHAPHVTALLADLTARKKLMEETPPEEVKYWFEYTGPLQKYFYRYSRSRKKADAFEGRDDSGVVSARFVDAPGGGAEYAALLAADPDRLRAPCLALGHARRPHRDGVWADLYGPDAADRCRALFVLATAGAGRGATLLWETRPPAPFAAEPRPWISEQETAATHLERQLREVDALCATGAVAARVQVLVCEPIPGAWTDWMDAMLPHCGGRVDPMAAPGGSPRGGAGVEERASPVQVVVTANAQTADVCHDLKSGFLEQRAQDLVLSPPYLTDRDVDLEAFDPAEKTTHADLVSSDDHDLYVALKWSTLVTARGVHGFLQASADLAAAAAAPGDEGDDAEDGVTVVLSDGPASPFLVPSFVRVSYVSEENNKVAKWRMHGDFFHPAAWEVCKDSFDMTWIPRSLSGPGGVTPACPAGWEDCGQWWVYFAEEQMSTSPEVYANEVTPPLVQGGSNYVWMLTEQQRCEVVKAKVCVHVAGDNKAAKDQCGDFPQAVIPLGDLESFLMNFTPNTALGKRHSSSRFPGYSRAEERKKDREAVKERKQLKDQEDIEKALFDYTLYPAALFHKDATLKAARARDFVLTGAKRDADAVGPQKIKSSYYDVTITKPREATSAWCQAAARKGLCTLYAEYFRSFEDQRCLEACGMRKNWSKIRKVADEL